MGTRTKQSSDMSAGTIVGSFAFSIFAVVTVVGNIFTIIAFKRFRQLRTLSNYFLVSLAVTDTAIGLFIIPGYGAYVLIGYWAFGTVVCDIWLCLDYSLTNASAAHLLVICLDRYLAVFWPMEYRNRRSPKKVCITIGIVWIASFLLWTPSIISWPYIEGQRKVPATECDVQFLLSYPSITVVMSLLGLYIPILIMKVLYLCIFRKISKRNKHLANIQSNVCHFSNPTGENNDSRSCNKQICNSGLNRCAVSICCKRVVDVADGISNSANTLGHFVEITTVNQNVMLSDTDEVIRMSAIAADISTAIMDYRGQQPNLDEHANTVGNDTRHHSQRGQKQDRKAAKVLSAILIAFLVTWLPYNVLAVLRPLCSTCVNNIAWDIAYGLYYVNSTVNPFLYALCNANFRRAYCSILTCRSRQLQ